MISVKLCRNVEVSLAQPREVVEEECLVVMLESDVAVMVTPPTRFSSR